MADIDWKSRITDSRDAAQASVDSLSASAREAVATARDRIGSTYGAARQRGGEIADTSRELAKTGLATGTRLAAQGKDVAGKAAFSARGLVAERPLTAIAAGIAAGLVLGVLANRLASGTSEPEPVEDEEIYD